MSDTPLFSVLIANYNNGCYLTEAVDSVRGQSYDHWEIVIVDDASTDNSDEVFEELSKDSRIRVFHNDRNHGAGYTKLKARYAVLWIRMICSPTRMPLQSWSGLIGSIRTHRWFIPVIIRLTKI